MCFNLNHAKAIPVDKLRGENEQETTELLSMLKEAQDYLKSFQWCAAIRESYFTFGIGGVVSIFLFRLLPKGDDVDEWLWVIVGDLPTAYITTKDNLTSQDALSGYIREMEAWVSAAKHGQSTDGLIPVNVPATAENSHLLRSRLIYLKENILPIVGR